MAKAKTLSTMAPARRGPLSKVKKRPAGRRGAPAGQPRAAKRPATAVRSSEEDEEDAEDEEEEEEEPGTPQRNRKAAKREPCQVAASREPSASPIEILYEGGRKLDGATFDKTLYFGQEHYDDFLHSLNARLPPAAATALPAWMDHLGQLSIGILQTKMFQHATCPVYGYDSV